MTQSIGPLCHCLKALQNLQSHPSVLSGEGGTVPKATKRSCSLGLRQQELGWDIHDIFSPVAGFAHSLGQNPNGTRRPFKFLVSDTKPITPNCFINANCKIGRKVL